MRHHPLYGMGDQQRSEATNPGEIYNENSANDIRNRVQEIVDLYFADTTLPAIASTSPSDNSSGVALVANLVATFNEAIALGTGNIAIRNLTNSTQTTIAVTDATQVSLSGSVLTINPTADLAGSKNYAVRIDVGAVKDLSNNSFAGIADDTTWNFATVVPGTIGSRGTITYTDASGLNPRSSPVFPGLARPIPAATWFTLSPAAARWSCHLPTAPNIWWSRAAAARAACWRAAPVGRPNPTPSPWVPVVRGPIPAPIP